MKKIKIKLTEENYEKLKNYSKSEINQIVNEALNLYFDKKCICDREFFAKEIERNIILGYEVEKKLLTKC